MRRRWAAAARAALNSAISCGPILPGAANPSITTTTSITAIPVAIITSTICSTSGFCTPWVARSGGPGLLRWAKVLCAGARLGASDGEPTCLGRWCPIERHARVGVDAHQ